MVRIRNRSCCQENNEIEIPDITVIAKEVGVLSLERWCHGKKVHALAIQDGTLQFSSGLDNHVWEPGGVAAELEKWKWLEKLYQIKGRFRLKEFSGFDQEAWIGIEIYGCEYKKYMLLLVNQSLEMQKISSFLELLGGNNMSEGALRILQYLELSMYGEQFVKRVGAPSKKVAGKRPRDPGRFSGQNSNGVQFEKNEVRELRQINQHLVFGIIVELAVKNKPRNNGCDEELVKVAIPVSVMEERLFKLLYYMERQCNTLDSEDYVVKFTLVTVNIWSILVCSDVYGKTNVERLQSCFPVCHNSESYKLMSINEETMSVVEKLCARSKTDIQQELDRKELVLWSAYRDERRVDGQKVQRSPYLILICCYCKNHKSISKQMKHRMSFHLEDKMKLTEE